MAVNEFSKSLFILTSQQSTSVSFDTPLSTFFYKFYMNKIENIILWGKVNYSFKFNALWKKT